MAEDLLSELRAFADGLKEAATNGESETKDPLRGVMDAAAQIGKAWSGSNLGYQSRVYYADLEPPPPRAHFDSEWGFLGTFHGTTGDWREFDFDAVITAVYARSGRENLNSQADLAAEATALLEATKPQVVSVLSAWLTQQEDALVAGLLDEASKVEPMNERTAQTALVGQVGTKITRDTTALSQGWQAAPHQVVEARAISIRSSFQSCEKLAGLASRGADHIARLELSQSARGQAPVAAGENVFIGHGRAGVWRELKDFLSERLALPWDEFNRVPVAGVTNIARLSEMLDQAAIAFLVLTAEDETADGGERARQNVVHEAGLFQGRLGFARAIVLLEEGCEEFSNIQGLGQIRFPAGDIAASFDEVRGVLEREGFLDSA
jgi:predicted nucleotide-binding protein